MRRFIIGLIILTALFTSIFSTGFTEGSFVAKVVISPSQLNLSYPNQKSNAEGQLKAVINPANAVIQTGVWTSSNETIVTVDQAGHVTATGVGSAVITFTSDDSSKGKKTATCRVCVSQAVTSVEMKESSGTIYVGGKPVQLRATVQPLKAMNKKIIWSSSNEEIATVAANGQVKGLKPGSVVITAKSPDGPSADYHATVEMKPVTLKVSGKAKCISRNHVGNSWGKALFLNDQQVKGTGKVTVNNGDTITVEWVIEEYDKDPDVGYYHETIEITPEIMTKGYQIDQTVWVTENGGRYSGNSAEWRVSITIKP